MGSFDMACGISGLSLGFGQPVKMYFIASNYDLDVLCYPTGLYVPCSFGIDMVYDDYGRYEFDVQQPAWQDFVGFLRKQAMHVPVGNNECHEQEFNPENPDHFDPEYLFDAMYDGRVGLKPFRKWLPDDPECIKVHPFPIHRDVFRDVCMAPGTDIFNKTVSVDSFQEEIEKRLDARILIPGFFEFADYLPYHTERLYGGYGLDCSFELFGRESLMRQCAELEMLFHCCLVNRIMFVPTMSAGQHFHYEENVAFHAGCAKIAKKLQRKLETMM
jgi:hypothetical protein